MTTPQEQSPFGQAPRSTRARWIWRSLLIGAPLVAIAAVVLVTRRPAATTDSAAGGHNHGAAPAAGQAQPVRLSADAARRIGVTYTTVATGSVQKEIRTVGQVTFDETRVTAVSPKVSGWIERLYVNYTGQPVQAGAPLLSIYSPMLVTAQEELLLAIRLARDVQGASADAQANAAEMVASARRRLSYWDIPAADIARIERSGQVQRTLTLRAPSTGVVVEKNVLQGQRIMEGDALYRVADLGRVWIEGEVFEQDLAAVRVGVPVTATVEALPGQTIPGRITYVYPTLNPETRTAKVRVELPNPGLRLKPGMYATLLMKGVSGAAALSVPRSTVLGTGTRNLVFVRRADGMLEPRDVTLGEANTERVAILNGLRAGEVVVNSATFLVDAESNLGSALGGMGDMPGMEMTAPATAPPAKSVPAVPAPTRPAPAPAAAPVPNAAKAPKAPKATPAPAPDHSGHGTANPAAGATEGHAGHSGHEE